MRITLCALLLTACSPGRPNVVDGNAAAERCHVLQECYEPHGADRDGCPDVAIEFAANSAALSPQAQATLSELVRETRDVKLRELGLVAGASAEEPLELANRRATAVRDWLREHSGQPLDVTFETTRRGRQLWFAPTCTRRP